MGSRWDLGLLEHEVMQTATLDRVSIELTNRCAKACWFCYDHIGQWSVQ
jgi:hypothetical protein